MEDKEQSNLSNSMKEFIQKIAEMRAVQYMIENVPKDNRGNAVADIVGIKNFGLFYIFNN